MAVQLSAESEQKIKTLLDRYPSRRAVMLPAVHLAMQEFPYIDDDVLQVPMVDVKGVATFYSMFPTAPHGKYLVQLCINLPCSLNGARRLLRYLENCLGVAAGETTADGRFTLRGMECLAACDKAPMMYVNEEQYDCLSEAKLDQILRQLPE
jgi:NADH:ubiquinone oxidoreductase subunit E